MIIKLEIDAYNKEPVLYYDESFRILFEDWLLRGEY